MTDFFRCLSLILLGAPGAVGATGWFVNQQSVLAIGRAGAGTVVDPTDPAAAYFNPAALLSPGVTYPSGTGWSLTQVLMPRASLRDLGSTASSPGTGLVAQPYPGTGFDNPTDPTPVPTCSWCTASPTGEPPWRRASPRHSGCPRPSAPSGSDATIPPPYRSRP